MFGVDVFGAVLFGTVHVVPVVSSVGWRNLRHAVFAGSSAAPVSAVISTAPAAVVATNSY